MKLNKYIFHIDFDSYFVSAVRSIRPELNNKPVAIAKNTAHAVAVSVSYELRAKGAHAGMKIYEILKIEPKTIVTESRFDLYNTISNEIFRYLEKTYSSEIEVASIDECFLFFKESQISDDDQALKVAKEIQNNILKKFKIPVSIGVSLTKFYSKMTTNISKPFGIGLTNKDNYKERFFDLDIERFHGIGKKTANKLRAIGIKTIKDLSERETHDFQLKTVFGTTIYKYLDALNIDIKEFANTSDDLKGVGNETSFKTPTYDERIIFTELNSLIQKVSERLNLYEKKGNIITLAIRKPSKNWVTKQKIIHSYTNDELEIKRIIYRLFEDNFCDQEIKGVGVRISGLIESYNSYEKVSLFEEHNEKDNSKINRILSTIKQRAKTNNIYTLKDLAKIQERESRFGKKIKTGLFNK
ncbi:Y-family DNA polymerase [Mycoplasmopsis edwardii]|uniref:DNA polymerase IV n=1 Tax=Mycoplasmopsis edwardii TaxID=53558 RepID=A0ACD4PH12_9BACT|nr:DNA polymerase IV [Mycoplasmopsis edwardii]WBP83942.1 DNA polymerase IV [Mycoplasmopsis edwardii]